MRFSEYHTTKNSEAFWYNYLLEHVPFSSETELLAHTADGSYMSEVMNRGLVETDLVFLYAAIDKYCAYNLFSEDKKTELFEALLHQCEMAQDSPLGGTAPDSSPSNDPTNGWNSGTVPLAIKNEFVDHLPNNLNLEQRAAFDNIIHARGGLFLLTGAGGCGKTFVLKTLINHYRQKNEHVLVSASSGAAAVRLSRSAQTNHSAYAVFPNQPVHDLAISRNEYKFIKNASCYIIDECSMMTSEMLSVILCRIKMIRGAVDMPTL